MRIWLIILIFFLTINLYSQVVINEVVYENQYGYTDRWGKTPDWIEIYNAGGRIENLNGWGLSDNSRKPLKWQFPNITIQPGEYLLIFASGRDLKDDTLHTNFKLQPMTDSLLLSYPDGAMADRFDAQCVPSDRSAARFPDGTDNWIISNTPTPWTSNDYSIPYQVNYLRDTLILSRGSGYYTEAFNLEMKNAIPGNKIYYTTNSEEPDENSILYQTNIYIEDRSDEENYFSEIEPSENYIKPQSKIFKGTIIRAVVYSDGCPASDIRNMTYLVQPEMRERYNVPVVSVIVEPDDFFSDETGIYVKGDHANFLNTGDEWEREIHLQIFDTCGNSIIDQNAGARIHGRGTRQSAQKSLRLYADEKYGKASFDYPFFSDRNLKSYKRLILRTTRGDWMNTLFTDILCHELVSNMDVDYMSDITTVVFINGEYWGIQALRERQDDEYIRAHYVSDASSIDIVDYDLGGPITESGSLKNYEELIDKLADENIADDELYVIANQMIDMRAMIDYFIAEIYLGNVDFPANNHTLWRPDSEEGKWRWFFYDCDGCFFRYNYDHFFDYLNEIDTYQRFPDWSSVILNRLLNIPEFRERFMNRFYQAIDTEFAPEKVIQKIDSLKALYQPLMAEHIDRWYDPGDIQTWQYNVDRLKQFAIGRPLEVTEQLLKYFGNPVLIYPVPASDYLMLKSDMFTSGKFQVRIYDMMGREISLYNFEGGAGEVQMNMDADIPDGVYLMRIYTGYYIQSQIITVKHD